MICSYGVPLVKLMTLNTWTFQVIVSRNSLLNIKSLSPSTETREDASEVSILKREWETDGLSDRQFTN